MIDRTVETAFNGPYGGHKGPVPEERRLYPLPIRLGARVRLFVDSAQAVVSRGSGELRTGSVQL